MRSARGFTLVELLVVFAISALVVSVVPVAFERLKESVQYRDVVSGLMVEMRKARSMAMSRREDVRFLVNLGQHSYGVDGGKAHELPETLKYRAVVASKELNQGLAAILFLADGGATGGSIDVLRNSGQGVRLQVDWLSGRVSQEPIAP